MILAEGLPAPAPEAFWQWLLCAGAALWILNQAFDFTKRHVLKAEPTPPYHRQFADKAETDEAFAAIETDMKSIKGDIAMVQATVAKDKLDVIEAGRVRGDALNETISKSVGKVHDRVDVISGAVSNVTGQVRAIADNVQLLLARSVHSK